MEFRPCIDIHNGKVKQIVGGSLRDEGDRATENFVADVGAADYARLYKEAGIRGGHIILLNAKDSEYYSATKEQAMLALFEYPQGMQIGGGITAENAAEFIEAGASHVIVTSYVFREGRIHYDRLEQLVRRVGKEHLVLDLSCRKTGKGYVIVTDRWQTLTDEVVSVELLTKLSQYCDEFLIHAVDVEGKAEGVEKELLSMLSKWQGIPITYAGGVHSYEDILEIKSLAKDRIHVTVGSALDLFGGNLSWKEIVHICHKMD